MFYGLKNICGLFNCLITFEWSFGFSLCHGETIAKNSIIDQQIQKLGTYEVLFPTVLPHSFVWKVLQKSFLLAIRVWWRVKIIIFVNSCYLHSQKRLNIIYQTTSLAWGNVSKNPLTIFFSYANYQYVFEILIEVQNQFEIVATNRC